jgi:hypothetical protein
MRVLEHIRSWRRRAADVAALDALGQGGREQMARDLAVSEVALQALAASDKTDELASLLRALELDPEVLEARDPVVMRDLAAVCAGCSEGARCRRELAGGDAADSFGEYCPNALSLTLLSRNEHAA